MKEIKCDLFIFVGYPGSPTCNNTIEVSEDNFKEACETMNKAGWKKCGGIYGNLPGWGYFCPEHAKNNQFVRSSQNDKED